MVVDPMTKVMDPKKLVEIMETGIWDLRQPIESLQKKRIKQQERHEAAKERQEARERDLEERRREAEERDSDICSV